MVMKGRGKNDYVQGNLSQKANHYNQGQLLKFSIKPLSILYNSSRSTNNRNLQLSSINVQSILSMITHPHSINIQLILKHLK